MMYSMDEHETNLNYDPVKKQWRAYSCYPYHMTRLEKQAGPAYWAEYDEHGRMIAGKWFLSRGQVALLAKQEWTDKQKAQFERMKQAQVSGANGE